MCSTGYPEKYKKNIEIPNLPNLEIKENNFIYHAGTTLKQNKVYTNGGRVLNFVSITNDYLKSRNEVIELINKLNWNGGFYRSDIGFKVIKK